jgi:hypothetical protein
MFVTFLVVEHQNCMRNASLLALSSLLGMLSLQLFATGKVSRAVQPGNQNKSAVLVELFTSEGCSSCPPADALLQDLDRNSPMNGVDVVVLSEHVDYWDDIGWRDPYSSHANTDRQQAYARQLRLPSVYTPQMVVDGRSQLVGSDRTQALKEIAKAGQEEKVPLVLTSIRSTDGGAVAAHLQINHLLASMPEESAQVFLGIADEADESHVSAGENSGRHLAHVAVLRKLIPVGMISKDAGFEGDPTVIPERGTSPRMRIVAFAQGTASGRILGVTSAHFSR